MNTDMPAAIGKYAVVRELGRGATASVYLARDPFAGRFVAIKMFRHAGADTDLFSGKHRTAFLNEAALVGKLQHPHIVQMLDAAVEREYSYIVMELVEGGTLAQYATVENLLPLEKAIEVVFKASRALEFAHRHGVIHRDIKPANILVTPVFDVKLSDFGVAILEGVTHTDLRHAGSPAYMSPEQLGDQALTHQTDIYSLGVVMYQLLTGRLPFFGTSHASLMYQIIHYAAPPVRKLRPDLPEAFEPIVARAMQKSLGDRYQSWIEFGRDLAALVRNLDLPREGLSDTRKYNALRNLSFFRDFLEVEIWEVLRISSWERVPADKVIIREGDRGDSFYVLVEGEVDVTRAGRELNRLVPGDCFGEMLYFADQTAVRSTTIRALKPLLVIQIKAASLSAASDACQVRFNKSFMRILIERLSAANQKLVDMKER